MREYEGGEDECYCETERHYQQTAGEAGTSKSRQRTLAQEGRHTVLVPVTLNVSELYYCSKLLSLEELYIILPPKDSCHPESFRRRV